MPKQITQAEIKAVLDHYQRAFEAALAIRHRIDDEGATIEPGRYSMESQGGKDPVSGYGDTDMSDGLAHWGMEIFETNPAPEWVTETPEDVGYNLTMFEPGGTSAQDIRDITRDEFVALKQHLAKMRGYAGAEVAHA